MADPDSVAAQIAATPNSNRAIELAAELGALRMRARVMDWAELHKRELSLELLQSLISCMNAK